MYKLLSKAPPADPVFKKIWKNGAMLRYKIFFCLLLHDRANTRNLLHRKSFHLPSYKCELCNTSTEETSLHLFWDCPFALECWDCVTLHRKRGISVMDEIMLAFQELPPKFAMEIIIMACWNIWIQRNSKIFKNLPYSFVAWRRQLNVDLLLIKGKIKHKHRETYSTWIDQYLT